MKITVAVLFFAFAAIAFAADPCLDASYASGVVNSVKGLSFSTFSGLTTTSSVNSALSAIGTIVAGVTTPWVQNVYVGLSNDDFYMIKNCRTQESPNFFCGNSTYVAYVRNTALYGDSVRHVFSVADPANVDASNANFLGTENTPYLPTQRFWFINSTGWSPLMAYGSGGAGKTFSNPFSTGVAAADRTTQEPCGTCASNSWAIPAVRTLSAANLAGFRAITNANQFPAIALILQDVMKNVGGAYTVNAYVGFNNGDDYVVKNCALSENIAATTQCAGQQWLFYVRNAAILGNTSRFIYALSNTGAIGNQIIATAAYDTINRPFFVTKNGWTDPYAFASGSNGLVGYTYTAQINGGVVAADRVDSEPCARGVATVCPTTTPSKSGASVVAACVFGLLSAIVFAAL